MLPTQNGAVRLFRFAGITVFLHWSWFVVALFEMQTRRGNYDSPIWNAAEYLSLFGIVLLHEFGHALACRSVGGRAEQIVLWPLGGVAYVAPPPRPGAVLWSIAAGPLVNVVLVPIFLIAKIWLLKSGVAYAAPDVYRLVRTVGFINLALFIFNMLPVYPLDGGQIVQSLLWFVLGRARSLTVSSVIGFIAGGALLVFSIFGGHWWFGILSVFILLRCVEGFKTAKLLAEMLKQPRHAGFACPSCKEAPRIGAFWRCGDCGTPFDTFETGARCPHCGAQFLTSTCPDCQRSHPMAEWVSPARPASKKF